MRLNLLAVVLLLATTIAAQDAPRAAETLEVSLVNVDVIVTDRAGNRVRGLKKEDFQIFENKKPQAVTNFAEYASAAAAATQGGTTAPAAEAPPPEKRRVLVFFEKAQMTGIDADMFGNALKQLSRDLLGAGDELSVVIWSKSQVRHYEFTSDPRKIEEALNVVIAEAKKVDLDESEQAAELSQAEQAFLESAEAASTGRGASVAAMTGANIESTLYLQREYLIMLRRVGAINAAITSMAGIEGRKMLILATRRLGEVAGADAIYRMGVDVIPQHLRQTYGTEKLIASIVANANSSRITIYPLHPPGLVTGPDGIPRPADYQILNDQTISHARIAKETGGLSAAGAKLIADLLPRVASDSTDYYSLAYRATPTKSDRSREIVVRTRNPEYVVRARTQIVDKSDETRMQDRLRATLFQPSPESQIAIVAKAGAQKKSGRRSTIPVEVQIPIGQLTMLPSGANESGRFSVYVAAATELNELSDVTKKTQPFDVPRAKMEQARSSHFTYELDVKVDTRSRYIAVGVYDEIGGTYGLQRLELKGAQ